MERRTHQQHLTHRALAWVALTIVASACVPPAQIPPPAPPPTPALSEEVLAPVERLDVAIVDFHETQSPDRRTVTVTGTLVNRGTRATRVVHVRVEALNKDGAVVVSADPAPSTQSIAPGTTATFATVFENRPDIDRYHAEAMSR